MMRICWTKMFASITLVLVLTRSCTWCFCAAAPSYHSFHELGKHGRELAMKGDLASYEQSVDAFRSQRKVAKGRKQVFTAYNNIAVSLLRLGNIKRHATHALVDYRGAYKMLAKARRINPKHKKIRKNTQLLEKTCKRRYAGASCEVALAEGSLKQYTPMFLFRFNADEYVDRGSELASVGKKTPSSSGYLKHLPSAKSNQISRQPWSFALDKAERAYTRHLSEDIVVDHLKADSFGMNDIQESSGVNSDLGYALIHSTQAANSIRDMKGIAKGQDIDSSNRLLFTILAATQNNLGAIYLDIASDMISRIYGTDSLALDSKAIKQISALVDEANSAISLAKDQVHRLKTFMDDNSFAIIKIGIANNEALAQAMKQQTQDMYVSLHGGVPLLKEDMVQEKTEKSGVGFPDKKRQRKKYPPVERLSWPPNETTLAAFGIHRSRSGISVGEFLRHCNRPIVIERTTEKDVQIWRLQEKWANLSYLEENLVTKLDIELSENSENLYGTNKHHNPIHAAEFFSRLKYMNQSGGVPHDGKYPYISLDIDEKNIPVGPLRDDINRIEFQSVSTGISLFEDPTKVLLWIGASNVSAIAHYDHAFNAFLMIRGSKRFIVASPGDTAGMYLHPAPGHSHRQSQLTNLDDIDYEKFPKARRLAFTEATLEEGDIIFLPPFWYHSVETVLGPSVAISVWSYPGNAKKAILELSGMWRETIKEVVVFVTGMFAGDRHTYLRILRAGLVRFVIKQLVAVFGSDSKVPFQQENSADASVDVHIGVDGNTFDSKAHTLGKFSPASFLETLIETKYSSEKTSAFCKDSSSSWCPAEDDFRAIPAYMKNAIDGEANRRAQMYGAHGAEHSVMGGLIREGAHIPVLMASVEYLSHVILSDESTLEHGDSAGHRVCDFIRTCLLHHVNEGTF